MDDFKYIFLGGVPKSGTSSLFDMLGQIPGVTSSEPKETFYLIDEDYIIQKEKNYFKQGWPTFQDFFPDSTNKIRLEGTTHLFYQDKIIPILKDLNAYFIFILRTPEERIRSSFEYSMNNLASFKKNISFSEFVDIFLDRPATLTDFASRENALKNLAQGKIIADYPRFIKKWKAQIPEERLFIVDYDFFKQKPQETVKRLMAKICPEITVEEISVRANNKTKGIKNIKLHNWLRNINKSTSNSIVKRMVKRVYFKLQKKKNPKSSADELALQKLKNAFDFNYKTFCDEPFKLTKE